MKRGGYPSHANFLFSACGIGNIAPPVEANGRFFLNYFGTECALSRLTGVPAQRARNSSAFQRVTRMRERERERERDAIHGQPANFPRACEDRSVGDKSTTSLHVTGQPQILMHLLCKSIMLFAEIRTSRGKWMGGDSNPRFQNGSFSRLRKIVLLGKM